MKDDPNFQHLNDDDHNAPALLPSSQLSLPPAEATKGLYKPLYPWQTRLVRLEPGSFQEPLKCKLLTADIIQMEGLGVHEYSGMLEYEAISYCWGEPIFDHAMQCEDQIVPITQNLAAALRQLRYPDAPRHLWIDALCICQLDDKEKSDQVQHMFAIFRKAKSVVAWLGSAAPNSHLAFQLLSNWKQLERDFIGSNHGHGLVCLQRLGNAYSALLELCRRPWFRRTWIRQEVFGAKHLIVQYGRFTHDWTDFPDVYDSQGRVEVEKVLSKASVPFETFDLTMLRSINIMKNPILKNQKYENLLYQRGAQAGSALWTQILVDGAYYFEKSELRDGVYAYVGLANEVARLTSRNKFRLQFPNLFSADKLIQDYILRAGAIPFPVDYSKSISEVYQDVVKYLINRFCSLGPLLVFESRKNRDPGLPSWVTDYRERKPRLVCSWGSKSFGFLTHLPERKQDLSLKNKLILMGNRVGVLGQERVGGLFLDMREHHLGVDADLNHFRDADSYKFRTLDIHPPTWAFVADAVQSGDLMVMLGEEKIPFVLRGIHKDEGPNEFLFLGPAWFENWMLGAHERGYHDGNIEEFVLV
jgi:hypothetical protein